MPAVPEFSVRMAQNHNFKLTAAMVVLFLVCWTPYFIVTIVHFADTDLYTGRRRNLMRIPAMLKTVLLIFTTLNSCANPYLCAYFSNRLRKQVNKLWRSIALSASMHEQDRQGRFERGRNTNAGETIYEFNATDQLNSA